MVEQEIRKTMDTLMENLTESPTRKPMESSMHEKVKFGHILKNKFFP